MDIQVNQIGDVVNFTLAGEVGEPEAEELKSRFERLSLAQVSELNIDFANVSHIGSAGIGKLLLFYKKMALGGGIIRVSNLSPTLREMFAELNLETIFTIS